MHDRSGGGKEPAPSPFEGEVTTRVYFDRPAGDDGSDAIALSHPPELEELTLAELTDEPCPACGMLLDLRAVPHTRRPLQPFRRNTPVMLRVLVCPECGWTGRARRG